MILAVTGHRPNKLGGYYLPNPVANEVMLKLAESLDVLKPSLVLTGMALGVDQWMAQICIDKKIPFKAVVPFPEFDSKWPPRSQQQYRWLLKHAAETLVLSPGPYDPSLLHQRNIYLVDHCDVVLAVWDGKPKGGTASTVHYAKSRQEADGFPLVYMLNLPQHIWEMATEAEMQIESRKGFFNPPVQRAPAPVQQPTKPKPQPKPPDGNLVYRRFVDVGEEDP